MNITVKHLSHMVPVSRELLADAPTNLWAEMERTDAVYRRQGSCCRATTIDGYRCSRRWRYIVGDRGYCWQHNPERLRQQGDTAA